MLRIRLFIWMTILVFAAAATNAQMVYVDDNAGGDDPDCGVVGLPCQTIQYALDNIAADGDTIFIETGTYVSTAPAATPLVVLPEGWTLTFIGDPNGGTILDLDNQRRGFFYDYTGGSCPSSLQGDGNPSDFALSFHNLTIINGYHDSENCNNNHLARGGAMMIINDIASNLDIVISDCLFENNRSEDLDGPNIGGRSADGGAIYINGRMDDSVNAGESCTVTITDCSFNGNNADQFVNGGHGGALYLRNLDASVENSSFCENFVYSENADNGDLNHDRNAGGAFLVLDTKNTSPGNSYQIDNCVFINNYADTQDGALLTNDSEGGAFFLSKGDNLSATNNAEVTISNSSFYANSIETGIEHVDNNGGSIDISNNNIFEDEFEGKLEEEASLCTGEDLILDPDFPTAEYIWQDGSSEATYAVTESGIYWVDIFIGACSTRDSISVNIAGATVDLGPDQVICDGASVLLDATNEGGTYEWTGGSNDPTLEVTESGEYIVVVDVDGCTASDTINISIAEIVEIDLGEDTSICSGESLVLDATTENAIYEWQDGSSEATFEVTESGEYSVALDIDGCEALGSINVEVTANPTVDLGEDISICDGASVTLDASVEGATYEWQDGSSEATYTVNGAGTYSVTVEVDGCLGTDEVEVSFGELPSLLFTDFILICETDTVLLMIVDEDGNEVNGDDYDYLWSDGSTEDRYVLTEAGIVWVTISDGVCTKTDSLSSGYYSCVFLPIELVRFEGETKENANLLSWETAVESDIEAYLLERSWNGVDFESIATIDAQLAESNTYEYADPTQDPAYYRLQTINTDGTKDLVSEVIFLDRANDSEYSLYPNPVNDILTIDGVKDYTTNINANIYDVNGKLILQASLNANHSQLNLQNLDDAVYFIELSNEKEVLMRERVIKF